MTETVSSKASADGWKEPTKNLLGGLIKVRTPVSEPLIAPLAGALVGPPSGYSILPSRAMRR